MPMPKRDSMVTSVRPTKVGPQRNAQFVSYYKFMLWVKLKLTRTSIEGIPTTVAVAGILVPPPFTVAAVAAAA